MQMLTDTKEEHPCVCVCGAACFLYWYKINDPDHGDDLDLVYLSWIFSFDADP